MHSHRISPVTKAQAAAVRRKPPHITPSRKNQNMNVGPRGDIQHAIGDEHGIGDDCSTNECGDSERERSRSGSLHRRSRENARARNSERGSDRDRWDSHHEPRPRRQQVDVNVNIYIHILRHGSVPGGAPVSHGGQHGSVPGGAPVSHGVVMHSPAVEPHAERRGGDDGEREEDVRSTN